MYRTLMLIICLLLTLSSLSFATHDKALLYGGAGQGRVIFDGRLHASKGMVCNDCHSAIFETHKKALIKISTPARSVTGKSWEALICRSR